MEEQLLEPIQLMVGEAALLALGLESLVERALADVAIPALERVMQANVIVELMDKLEELDYAGEP